MSNNIFIDAKEAARIISDGDVVATGGFVGIGVPEEILIAIEEKFHQENSPKDLTIVYAAGQGDGKTKGLNHLAYEGLVKKVIGGHWGLAPRLGTLALENKIEGYNFPQGVLSHAFRDMAAGKKGTISKIGIGTFVDPKLEGGKINSITKEDLVTELDIDGDRHLYYKIPKLNVAILRGTSADEDGNISLEKEALTLETLAIAMATKNSGGKVIVQVEKKVKRGSIDPKAAIVPGIFVDYIVICKDPKNHAQTFGTIFDEAFVNSSIVVEQPKLTDIKLDERKIIARRCAMFLNRDMRILNYGIGMPEGIADVLRESGQEEHFTPTVEPGAIGGTPAGGLNFGASITPQAIIDQPYQFDFYDGGGLDATFLGLAQCDKDGNINVSKFGPKIAGCGGFINISQNSKNVIFCGTFTAGGLKIEVKKGQLNIVTEGKNKKFINAVEQITFSGDTANGNNQPVYYVTERAVFQLGKEGLILIEIAPGVDLKKDILEQMEFEPIISENLKTMDWKIFDKEKFKLEL